MTLTQNFEKTTRAYLLETSNAFERMSLRQYALHIFFGKMMRVLVSMKRNVFILRNYPVQFNEICYLTNLYNFDKYVDSGFEVCRSTERLKIRRST